MRSILHFLLRLRTLTGASLFLWLVPLANAQVGRLERGTIASAALGSNLFNDPTNRSYAVYLPPSYTSGERRYPVFYMLHGWTGNFESHLDSMPTAMDRLIASRRMGELIAVFVDGSNAMRGFFYRSSSVIGDYETYIARELVDLIDARYRTLATPSSRAIAGYSMGGYGALHLAFHYPDIFSVVSSQSGYYDAADGITHDALKAIARAKPTTAEQISRMALRPQALMPFLTAAAFDPARPPFYFDPPYLFENGQYSTNTAALQRLWEADIVHGHSKWFLGQPVRLRAIQVIHGTADTLVPISQARALHESMTSSGLDHDYQEHGGGHEFLNDLSLTFLSQALVGAELYIQPPRLSWIRIDGDPNLEFNTQTGVEYRVEQRANLNDSLSAWTPVTTLKGTGGNARVAVPTPGSSQFLRVSAINAPSL